VQADGTLEMNNMPLLAPFRIALLVGETSGEVVRAKTYLSSPDTQNVRPQTAITPNQLTYQPTKQFYETVS
jgi:hypothetical protein